MSRQDQKYHVTIKRLGRWITPEEIQHIVGEGIERLTNKIERENETFDLEVYRVHVHEELQR